MSETSTHVKADHISREAKPEDYHIQEKLFDTGKSQVRKYQDIVIGKRGVFDLIKYELIMLLSIWVPGALGLFLRSKFYPLLLGKVGKGVVFGRNVVLRHPHKIHLGDNIAIDDNCVLDAKGTDNRGIIIENNVFIGRNSALYVKDGDIEIGCGVVIGYNCQIYSGNFVKIGNNVQIAAYSYIIGGTPGFSRIDIPILEQERSGRGILVEDDVWLAANVKVLDGVTIGRGSIIGAGAVVNKEIPPLSIAGGVPAKVIRKRVEATDIPGL